MIRLTDEEIRASLMARPKIKTMNDLVENFNLVAKAQLKKVVEECGEVEYLINDYGEWGHCRTGWEDSNATHVAIPYKVWQSLLDEVKE